jgi:hypothetical protein
MHWHWLTSHLTLLGYGYEVLGGILIFYSSAVTETSMPADRKRWTHWIMFGVIAVVYIVCGIGLRFTEIQRNDKNTKQADEDRQELRDNRKRMDSRIDSVLSSSQVQYLQLASLSSEIGVMRNSVLQAIYKNDPRQIRDLESKMQAAQQQADTLSHELLALTMAPQVAGQLLGWEEERHASEDNINHFEWEAEQHYQWDHPGDKKGLDQVIAKYAAQVHESNNDFREKLKGIIVNADFVRKELLQRIPAALQVPAIDKPEEQKFTQARTDPDSLDRKDAARYLEQLAQRVPPPK